MRSRRSKSQHGVVAVIVAISSVTLLSLAAIAVDLGNAMVRKRDVQSQADFAALAGAAQLGVSNIKSPSDPAVIAVAAYLTENQPQDDTTLGPDAAITPAQLVDGGLNSVYPAGSANGEVYFLSGDQMRVVSPPARVNFGLAGVMGYNNTDVVADATVGVRSFGNVLPFFTVDGCDYGPQTITDPTPGAATGLNLAFPAQTNNATLDLLTPDQVALDTATTLDILGSNFTTGPTGVTEVGFFKNDASLPEVVTPVIPTDGSNIHLAAVPTAVTSVADVWYVRVFKGAPATGEWSPMDQALPFRVGNAVLQCVGVSNGGNFGSIKLPRLDSTNSTSGGWLPINIAAGLESPLTLGLYPGSPPPDLCTTASEPPAVISTSTVLKERTNCVDTDTGLTDNSATAGFITGVDRGSIWERGRLDEPTTPGCGADPADRDAKWDTGIDLGPGPGGNFTINDDILTCFFTNPTTTIADISDENYAGPSVLDPSIYDSPRFFLQPVLALDPSTGGSEKYTIIDMRPGFITDQVLSSDKATNAMGSSTDHNGLTIDQDKVGTVKVVFFDFDALPEPDSDVPTVSYMGVGPRLIRLVD